MGFGKSKKLTHRKRVSKGAISQEAVETEGDAAAVQGCAEPDPVARQPGRLSSNERYLLFARLAWLTCYSALFAAEAASDPVLMGEIASRFTSTYTRRVI